jgi:hypothetical protein
MNGTFRSVVRPNKVLITTDLAGVLSFAGRATSFIISSGQSAAFSSVTNTQHLIDSQLIEINNTGSSTILVAAGLMANGVGIDIEPNTVQILAWSGTTNKFLDVGGTANTKNIDAALVALTSKASSHAHTGLAGDYAKIKATDLNPVGGLAGDFFMLNGSGAPVWFDPLAGTAEQNVQTRNTDTTTNFNTGTTAVTLPMTGQTDFSNPYFVVQGSGLKVVGYTGMIKASVKVAFVFGATTLVTKVQFQKNGAVQPGHALAAGINPSATLTNYISVVPNDVITVTITRVTSTQTVTFDGMNSTLALTIPTSALARGPDGVPGTPGWTWRSGFGAPSAGLGVNQDVYLDKTNMDLYEKISGVWTLSTNIQGDVGPVGPSRVMLWAERNGTLTNNTDDWSFGSGSTTAGKYMTMMGSGRVTKLSFHAITAGTAAKTIEIMKNGASSGQSITVAANVATGTATFGTPVSFVDGDRIGFRTVLGGSAAQARVAAIIELD